MTRRFIFLDRDGTINVNPGADYYVKSPDKFKLIPGTTEALRRLRSLGYRLVIVSNQSGVARGELSADSLEQIHHKMHLLLDAEGACVEKVLICPHDDGDQCACRKPKPGLLEKAAAGDIDKADSWIIGDSERDIIAGQNFNVKTIAVTCGKSSRSDIEKWTARPDHVVGDLNEASLWLENYAKS